MPEQVQQWICIKFCIKLEHSSVGTIQIIQKLWALDDWQLHHDNVPAHASHLMQSFLAKHQITQLTQPAYSTDLALRDFWLFPKLKSPLKGKFQTGDEIQENTMGQLMAIRKTVRSQGAYFEGDWGIIILCARFLVSCIFFNKCLFFILHGWTPSEQTSCNTKGYFIGHWFIWRAW